MGYRVIPSTLHATTIFAIACLPKNFRADYNVQLVGTGRVVKVECDFLRQILYDGGFQYALIKATIQSGSYWLM